MSVSGGFLVAANSVRARSEQGDVEAFNNTREACETNDY